MISCIHLEEQTKDILKLKSVLKYNLQGCSEASEVGVGCQRILPEIRISMLKIYLKCNNNNELY